MSKISGKNSKSGVFIADDFRDNLIIDRFDECFVTMRASKMKHLKSENSEDAISWNVFRTLRQITPNQWLPLLGDKAFGDIQFDQINDTTIELWKEVASPPSFSIDGDEDESEIDIVIENPKWVWFIEAKYLSDISEGTTTRKDRDQVLRNIDVGSYYAGTRKFYFSLLYYQENRTEKGIKALETYKDMQLLKGKLPHRDDGLSNLCGLGLVTWHDIYSILINIRDNSIREEERDYASRAINWLNTRNIN